MEENTRRKIVGGLEENMRKDGRKNRKKNIKREGIYLFYLI
jgi:hypothetical protein